MRRGLWRVGLALGALAATGAQAMSFGHCESARVFSAAEQDRLLRVSARIKAALEGSGQRVALVARSGIDLSRFAQRYSHAGVSLRASRATPWAVRQLYFDCERRQARLFDQGLAAFVLGTDDPDLGFLSVLLLPAAAADEVERAALDDELALQLLGASYSANAYPFDTRHQNCNQWLVELLGVAWGGLARGDDLRGRAQGWLQGAGYQPTRIELRPPLWTGLAAFVPWLHTDDHPPADLQQQRVHVSLPASIEGFVQARWPQATRLEFCHTRQWLVMRRNGAPIAAACEAGPGDEVVRLDDELTGPQGEGEAGRVRLAHRDARSPAVGQAEPP